jgi:hypothetical protein
LRRDRRQGTAVGALGVRRLVIPGENHLYVRQRTEQCRAFAYNFI